MGKYLITENDVRLLVNEPYRVNEAYDHLLASSDFGFINDEVCMDFCRTLVSLCFFYGDYMRSNNVLQFARDYENEHALKELPVWHDFYSLLVYSQRIPKLFLNNPPLFWKKVRHIQQVSSGSKETNILDIAIRQIMETFLTFYQYYPNEYREPLLGFSEYFLNEESLSKKTSFMFKEVSEAIRSNISDAPEHTLKHLTFNFNSQIDNENKALRSMTDTSINNNLGHASIEQEKNDDSKEKPFSSDNNSEKDASPLVSLEEEDTKIKIVFIGNLWDMNKKDLESIFIKAGYRTSKQWRIYSYYKRTSNTDFNFLSDESRLEYSGILVGSCHHSNKYMGSYSSLDAMLLDSNNNFPNPINLCPGWMNANHLGKNKFILTKSAVMKGISDINTRYLNFKHGLTMKY
jgi:hypothetical protein